MRQTRLSAADQVSLSNALYTAATSADEDSQLFRANATHVPANLRIAEQFAARAIDYRLLAERIDEAGAIILSDE